ncbi:hypothetical protein GY45DRAFT_1251963 [Cubamyces sp. BRFM 1775]|nr:hypothetical protein GY45DRAFT_1251963 [Cubamyces sp. BRFM 1775]
MASTLDNLLSSSDITDSTDFPDTSHAPGLRPLDEALRCNICRDFYDAPVSLTCGHSFCSVCIRSALPVNATCPLCRKPASEVHLRKDIAVETAVQAWKTARPLILRLANQEVERKSRPQPIIVPRRGSDEPTRKRKRSGSPNHTSDDEVVIAAPSSPLLSGSATPDALPDTVECPICQKFVHSQNINTHIDSNCKRYVADEASSSALADPKGKQRQQWGLLFGNKGSGSSTAATRTKGKSKGKARAREGDDEAEPEHLPKVAYDIHPRARIAEMLNEWDLPTHGDKNTLIRRHSKWIVLYNANVDRAPEHRRSLEQLRNELRKMEEAEQKTRKETVDDPVAYQRANRDAFAKLTEAARPKKTKDKQADEEPTRLGSPATAHRAGSGATGADSDGGTKDVIDVDAS